MPTDFGPNPFDGQKPEDFQAHLDRKIENLPPEVVAETVKNAEAAFIQYKNAPVEMLKKIGGFVLGAVLKV